MTDLDQLLENASTDVKTSLRTVSTPSPEKIHRRAQRRSATKATAVVVLVASLGASAWLLSRGSDGSFSVGGDALITSEVILQDGVVTEEELRAGAEAVVACVAEAGFEAEVNFDGPDGSPGFTGDVAAGSSEASDRCFDVHLSNNVLLGWSVTIGWLDLDQLRAEDNALVECVERLTGVDFGEVTHDDFGYLTEEGQQTRDAAFEFQDHEIWIACQYDLGYLDEQNAETKALVECAENRTGEDFGDLTFDGGVLTEEGQQTLRAAVMYQNHGPWEACQQELGLQ